MPDRIVREYEDGSTYLLEEYYENLRRTYTVDEKETLAWIVGHCQPDWVSIDVGAHMGIYTGLLSKLGQWVHAFEACFETYESLLVNLATNKCQNVTTYHVAVGDEIGVRRETLWFAGVASIGREQVVKDTELSFTTLDHQFLGDGAGSLARLDFIKIDVDGWDYQVLRGARGLIDHHRPFVSIEVNRALERLGWNVRDLCGLVEELGYLIKPMDCPAPGNWLLIPEERCVLP